MKCYEEEKFSDILARALKHFEVLRISQTRGLVTINDIYREIQNELWNCFTYFRNNGIRMTINEKSFPRFQDDYEKFIRGEEPNSKIGEPWLQKEESEHYMTSDGYVPIHFTREVDIEDKKDDKNCRGSDGTLVCGYADFVVHEHDSNCYDENGNLWCPLPEIKEHTHNDSCYKQAEGAHTHDDSCYTVELGRLICTKSEEEAHTHNDSCYTEYEELICGKPETLGHQHQEECYNDEGVLVCGEEQSEGHQHSDECRKISRQLTCELAKGSGHTHTDECYEQNRVLTCKQSAEAKEDGNATPTLVCEKEEILLHTHDQRCFDADKKLICEKREVREHVHSEECFQIEDTAAKADDAEPVCGLEEHTHTDECKKVSESTSESKSESSNGVVIRAYVIEKDASDKNSAGKNGIKRKAGSARRTVDVSDLLTKEPTILINGVPYDGTSPLYPGDEFALKLEWDIDKADLGDNLSVQYKFPSQIKIESVPKTELKDENGTVKAEYSIDENGVLNVTYVNPKDIISTSFELVANWNLDEIKNDTTINWGNGLETPVKFKDEQIVVTKKILETREEDGSLVGIYQIEVSAEHATGDVLDITLTDTMEAEKFKFLPDYFEDKKDYRHKGQDDTDYEYGDFTTVINDDENKNKQFTISGINLQKGEKRIIEYAVVLDAEDRQKLDVENKSSSLTNTAEGSYTSNGENIKSSSTVTDTYTPPKKMISKEVDYSKPENKDEMPWAVTVNPDRNYAIGGAAISDVIGTEKVY